MKSKKRTPRKRKSELTTLEQEHLIELRRQVWVEEVNLGTAASALDWLRITLSHYPPRESVGDFYLRGLASTLALVGTSISKTKYALRAASDPEKLRKSS